MPLPNSDLSSFTLLDQHKASGYLDCPVLEWSCWRSDRQHAERLLSYSLATATPFDPESFLHSMSHRSVVYVGDSLVRQQYVSLFVERPSSRQELRSVFSAPHNLTVTYALSRFLVKGHSGRLVFDEPSEGLAAAVSLRPDLLLLSASHWFEPQLLNVSTDDAVFAQFRAVLRQVRGYMSLARRVGAHRALRQRELRQVVVRTAPQRHFAGGEWYSGGHCNFSAPAPPASAVWRDRSLQRHATAARVFSAALSSTLGSLQGVSILDISGSTSARVDAHVGPFRCPKCLKMCEHAGWSTRCTDWIYDCSHYCLPGVPDGWNAQLQELIQRPFSRGRRLSHVDFTPSSAGRQTRATSSSASSRPAFCMDTDAFRVGAEQTRPKMRRWIAEVPSSSLASPAVACPAPYRRSSSDRWPRSESLCCPESTRRMRPVTCDGSVRTLDELTPLLSHQRIALVGDSLMNHLYVEWGRLIGAVGFGRGVTLQRWCEADAAREPERYSYAAAHNITLFKYSMHLRPKSRCNASSDASRAWLSATGSGGGSTGATDDVDISMLEKAFEKADVVVANVGVHWRAGHEDHYRRAVRAVMHRLKRAHREGRVIAMYKETTPQHFSSTDGSGYYERRTSAARCDKIRVSQPYDSTYRTAQWRTAIEAEEALRVFGAADRSRLLVPQFAQLVDRFDAHTYPDCTHFCYERQLWNGMLDPFVRQLQRLLLDRPTSSLQPSIRSISKAHSKPFRQESGGALLPSGGVRMQFSSSWACAHLSSVVCRLPLDALKKERTIPRIPRRIHQSHKGELSDLPTEMRAATTTWEELNPEYEYVYYSDRAMREYVEQRGHLFSGFSEAFAKATSGAMRCDLWRYLLIWSEGGVYADADSVVQRPLREGASFLRDDDEALTGFGQDALEQYVLAYRARHPIMRRVLERAISDVQRLAALTTLCYALQDVLHLSVGDEHFCLAQHHLAPKMATGVYHDPKRAVSIRVLPGHFACRGRSHPPGYRASTGVPARERWSPSCVKGIQSCPCVWRDDSELVVRAKYNYSQYLLDLHQMRARYYDVPRSTP
ncbi:MAG: hypothetical protein SGPRY_010457 [Prymnesium sp.]